MLIVLSYCAPGIILHEMFCYNCWKIIGTWDSWECWASIGSELQSLSWIALMNYWAFNFLRYIVECGLSCRVYSCWIFLDASASLGLGVIPIYQCWNKSLILHISYYIFMQHIHATFLDASASLGPGTSMIRHCWKILQHFKAFEIMKSHSTFLF